VAEYYEVVHGVFLPELQRPDDFRFREDPFHPKCHIWGFTPIKESEPPRDGDVLSFRLGSNVPNHLGIFGERRRYPIAQANRIFGSNHVFDPGLAASDLQAIPKVLGGES